MAFDLFSYQYLQIKINDMKKKATKLCCMFFLTAITILMDFTNCFGFSENFCFYNPSHNNGICVRNTEGNYVCIINTFQVNNCYML